MSDETTEPWITRESLDEIVTGRAEDGVPVLVECDMPDDDIRTIAEFLDLPYRKVKGIVWFAEAYIADLDDARDRSEA